MTSRETLCIAAGQGNWEMTRDLGTYIRESDGTYLDGLSWPAGRSVGSHVIARICRSFGLI
ncbi:MAG: hypothetical protein QOF92_4876 [Pseudonocardiales bacterium]|nr:hypothetical protein [Pseudonocardiales bacterium]